MSRLDKAPPEVRQTIMDHLSELSTDRWAAAAAAPALAFPAGPLDRAAALLALKAGRRQRETGGGLSVRSPLPLLEPGGGRYEIYAGDDGRWKARTKSMMHPIELALLDAVKRRRINEIRMLLDVSSSGDLWFRRCQAFCSAVAASAADDEALRIVEIFVRHFQRKRAERLRQIAESRGRTRDWFAYLLEDSLTCPRLGYLEAARSDALGAAALLEGLQDKDGSAVLNDAALLDVWSAAGPRFRQERATRHAAAKARAGPGVLALR